MEDPETLRQDAGIDMPEASTSQAQPRLKRIKVFTCEICYTEGNLQTMALGCNHRYCKDCYTSYLEQKIREEGEAKAIQCMAANCNIVMDERTVSMLVDSATLDR